MMPVRMPFWMLGANNSVATNVTVPATPSSMLARQALRMMRMFTRLVTAIMMMAASTALGRWCSSGVRNSSVRQTNAADTSDDSLVRAPADRLSAERENDPLTGIDMQNAATILAKPWPISSRFSSHRVRVRIAMILELDIASMKLISAMTKLAGNRASVAVQSSGGTPNDGRPLGMMPTTVPPSFS